MISLYIYVAVAVLLLAALMLLIDIPVITALVSASGAGERLSMKLFLPLLLLGSIAAASLLPAPGRFVLEPMGSGSNAVIGISLILATMAAVLLSRPISPYVALPHAFLGALAGSVFAAAGSLSWTLVIKIAGSQAVSLLLTAVLSALLCRVSLLVRERTHRHLALSSHSLLLGSILAAMLCTAAFGWNNALILNYLPDRLGLGHRAVPLMVASALVITALCGRRALMRESWQLADLRLDIPVRAIFSVLVSMGVVMALFSMSFINRCGLVSVPLSASLLMVAGLSGASVGCRNAFIGAATIIKTLCAALLTPLLAFLLSYCLAGLLADPYGAGGVRAVPAVIVLGVALTAAGLYLYLHSQRQRAYRRELLRSREQQVQSARKSLSALEVKAEMTEKDLQNKLDIKRKELVDFAVGISGQKAYMEQLYEKLGQLRETPSVQEKDRMADQLLRSLRSRMRFSAEMNDFYAQSELLHEGFNLRLKESFPSLPEGERKLANMLRQGLSSKQIASLMNISPKSVEINRYRLRSKLGLRRSDNLIQFIKSL